MGFIVGILIGIFARYDVSQILTLGVQAATALRIFPMVAKLFMEALAPISDAASEFMKKRFPGREKQKVVVIREISKSIESGKKYSEKDKRIILIQDKIGNVDSFRAALYAAMLWQLVQTGRFAAQCALASYLGSVFLIVYGR